MTRTPPRIIMHLDSEKSWRGGQNQMRLLLEGAQHPTWQWHLAAPPDSESAKRLTHLAHFLPLAMGGVRLLSAAWTLRGYIRKHKIQLLDCQSGRAHNLGLLLKRLCPELKLVVHRRVDYPPAKGYWHRQKYLSPDIDRYICISNAIRSVLLNFGVPADRLTTVYSAVPHSDMTVLDRQKAETKLRSEWNLAPTVPIIGNIAYITAQKDHATLIQALALVKAKGVPFFAFIAGDGHLKAEAEAMATHLGLEPNQLRFLGIRSDVHDLLAAADIFALSSRDEGLGTSLLDAVQSGCALVTTDVGGIPEIVEPNRTGLSSPAQNVASFAHNISRLLTEDGLRETLSQQALAHVKRRFSLAAMIAGNLQVYSELLPGPGDESH